MGEPRVLPAARLRLGMRLANGLTVAEIERPERDTVKTGYGRVWVGFHDPTGCDPDIDCLPPACGVDDHWLYYPHDRVTLALDEDAPADPTMDDWPGVWWPTSEDGAHYDHWRNPEAATS